MDAADDPTLHLLERHVAGDLDRDELVQQLTREDPRLGLMARLMTQRASGDSDREDDAEATEAEARIEDALRMTDEARRMAETVRREFDDVVGEIDGLRHRLDVVAAALGACSGCWGDDPDCRWCRGRGQPGTLAPDLLAFDRMVMPAVRMQAEIQRRNGIGERTKEHERRSA